MINFKNQSEILEYLANNSKHYTPKSIIDIISKRIKDVDFTDLNILETSVGEGDLLANLVANNETLKKANIYVYDLEEFNVNIAKQRLELMGCLNIKTFVGDFMKWEHQENDYNFFDYCFQNPPYGTKVEFEINDFWKETLHLKKNKSKTPETAFLGKVARLSKVSFNILPVGVLFRTGWENKVIEDIIDNIKYVTLMPSNLFKTTSIPVIIMELNESNTTLKMTDVSDLCYKNGKINDISEEQLNVIYNQIYLTKKSQITKYLSYEEIKKNKFNLNITRYIQRVIEEPIDIDLLAKDIDRNIESLINMFDGISEEIGNKHNVKYKSRNVSVTTFRDITKELKKLI